MRKKVPEYFAKRIYPCVVSYHPKSNLVRILGVNDEYKDSVVVISFDQVSLLVQYLSELKDKAYFEDK